MSNDSSAFDTGPGRADSTAGERWFPIKDAPKDGTPIIAYVEIWRCFLVAYFDELNGMQWRMPVRSNGFVDIPEPTFWMPLPPAPRRNLTGR